MSDEDRAKDVLDLDDKTLANFARYTISQTRKVHERKVGEDGAAASITMHGVISLALLALSTNAGRLTSTVSGVTYRGEDKGDWRFTIERLEDALSKDDWLAIQDAVSNSDMPTEARFSLLQKIEDELE